MSVHVSQNTNTKTELLSHAQDDTCNKFKVKKSNLYVTESLNKHLECLCILYQIK